MTTYRVDGMTCQGCADAVRRAVATISSQADSEIDLAHGLVTVPDTVAEADVREAVGAAGFDFRGRVGG